MLRNFALLMRAGAMTRLLLLGSVVFGLFTVAAWLAPPVRTEPFATPEEKFDPRMAPIKSTEQLAELVNSLGARKTTMDKVYILEQLLRYRFYSGFSRYSFHDNWLTWLAARTIDEDYDAIVAPEDILSYEWAGCSQQALVVQEILRQMGVRYASVGVPHHFFTAAWIDGSWYIVDPFGPIARDHSRLHKLEEVMTDAGRNRFFLSERTKAYGQSFAWDVPQLKSVDAFPAARIRTFHRITRWASHWGWLALLMAAVANAAARRRWSIRWGMEARPRRFARA